MIKPLRMTVKNKKTTNSAIHHSGRGLQYCSSLYQEELEKHKIRPSMTDGYDCYQNVLAERMNGTLKQRYLIRKTNNKKELQKMIEEAFESYKT